jgi:hypothetical protein
VDPVPTRLERLAAVVAVFTILLVVPAAALGSGVAVVVLFFVAFSCGAIAKARTGLDGLLTFGLRSVPDDDPEARRYWKRREREDERIRDAVSFEYDPRLDRLLAIGLAILGIGALAAVAAGVEDVGQLATHHFLMVGLFGLNCALIVYAASYMNTDD